MPPRLDNYCRSRFLWERACSRKHHRGLADRPQRLLREQARSHIKPISTLDWRHSINQLNPSSFQIRITWRRSSAN
ncbi:hypothetical protein DBR46_06610 [Pseudomonas sp. KBW05]|nr:hypothetical protein DBR46_06610 [Pseudomonas sp. KBW05]